LQIAITRGVSAGIAACELTHVERQAIDLGRARAQHRAYEEALARAGCRVESLPALDDLPDSVFVEDVAVVLDEIAIATRPGAESRRPEAVQMAPVLSKYRRVTFVQAPGTLDGGDVLRLGRRIYVGRSGRSDEGGIEQLRTVAWPYGYTVTAVPVSGCLHLKSAVTEVAPGTVLVNPGWVDPAVFGHVSVIEVDAGEPYAANGLHAGGRLIYPTSFPRTRERLEHAGIGIEAVDVSELHKAEGAVTCCSLVFSE
jgi:dimethylargininase